MGFTSRGVMLYLKYSERLRPTSVADEALLSLGWIRHLLPIILQSSTYLKSRRDGYHRIPDGTTPCKNNERPVLLLLALSPKSVLEGAWTWECVDVCERGLVLDLKKHSPAFTQRHFVSDGATTPLQNKRNWIRRWLQFHAGVMIRDKKEIRTEDNSSEFLPIQLQQPLNHL